MTKDLVGTWEFNKQVASNFVDHIRRSIPYYNELQDDIVRILGNVLGKNCTIIDIGGATGETISRINKRLNKKVKDYIYIDNSVYMYHEAKKLLSDLNNVTFHNCCVESLNLPVSDAVIMLYTLQFISYELRLPIVKNIYNSLHRGGIFILCEKVICEKTQVETLYGNLLQEIKSCNGFTQSEIQEKQLQLQNVLLPLTIEGNIALLENAGFINFDVFFKSNNFAGFIAFK